MEVFCMGWKELVFSRPPPLSIPPPGWAAYVHLKLGLVHGWLAMGLAEHPNLFVCKHNFPQSMLYQLLASQWMLSELCNRAF